MAMTDTQTKYVIALNEAHRELHFAIQGLWQVSAMRNFLRELTEASLPYLQWSESFRVIADMDDFVPQNRDTAETIRQHLECARDHGLQRLAIVTRSPLVRMQYRRIAASLDIAFFDTKLEALHWSREFDRVHRYDAA